MPVIIPVIRKPFDMPEKQFLTIRENPFQLVIRLKKSSFGENLWNDFFRFGNDVSKVFISPVKYNTFPESTISNPYVFKIVCNLGSGLARTTGSMI